MTEPGWELKGEKSKHLSNAHSVTVPYVNEMRWPSSFPLVGGKLQKGEMSQVSDRAMILVPDCSQMVIWHYTGQCTSLEGKWA